jgi:gluconolactonase
MRNILILCLLLGACSSSAPVTQSLSDILPAGAEVRHLNPDMPFTFTEGPVVDDAGYFYFSDMDSKMTGKGNRIMKMTPDGTFSVFQPFYNGNTNGLLINRAGNILAAEMYGHRVVEIDPNGNVLRVVADSYNGVRLDGPNDMVMDRKGGLYVTDPRYLPQDQWEQDTEAVYYLPPGGSDLVRVLSGLEKPNGILLSPDEQTLYVNDTQGEYIYAWDVQPDGAVSNKREFTRLELAEESQRRGPTHSGADGMALDVQGNLYVTTALGVQVINAAGVNLGTIAVPEVPANCGFGGNTLYITARTGVYAVDLLIPGLIFPQPLN